MQVEHPPSAQGLLIGEAARHSGVSAANIRFYEKQGLLVDRARADNSYRRYGQADVHRLRFIRMCRAMDMSLEEVRTLLSLDLRRKVDCTAARTTLDAHLGHVRARLAELAALEHDLLALRDACNGSDGLCHTIEALHQRADERVPLAPRHQAKRHV